MKKNKGFTLVEMLGVTIILGLLIILVVPNLMRVYKRAQEKEYKLFMERIERVVIVYAENNKNNIKELGVIGGHLCINLQDIVDAGLLNSPQIDPKTKTILSNQTQIQIIRTDKDTFQIEYNPKECRSYAPEIPEFVMVDAGSYFSLALKLDGTVWAWGQNSSGQLGNGTTEDSYLPIQVKGHEGEGYLTDIIQIAAGSAHSVALKRDGTVWTWGNNSYGQLGDGTTTNKSTPVQVRGVNGEGYLTNITQISARTHTIALTYNGTVISWGNNMSGQLGDGTAINKATPVQVKDLSGTGVLTNIKQVVAGKGYSFMGSEGYHSAALINNGTVLAWGYNGYGQLGNQTTESSLIPVETIGLTDVVQITSGQHSLYALKNNGTVWAWGYNIAGSLGDGTTTDRHTPVQVKGPEGEGYLTNIIQIKGGYRHTVALKNDDTVWTWGINSSGQLGDGTTTSRLTPVQVKGIGGEGYLTNVKYISAGGAFPFGLGGGYCIVSKDDGSVWTWGYNLYGQLGDGTTTKGTTPKKVFP
ncbi:MAG: prepilin-type N-terminal cleavage/methylation domain-containing protein [Bacilli bacterium]